jgi:hypothetical protein
MTSGFSRALRILLAAAMTAYAAVAPHAAAQTPSKPPAGKQPPQTKPPAKPPAQQPKEPVRVNEDARLMADFEKRIQDYVALHNKLEATLPRLPKEANPQQIDAHQRALARLIERARANAKQGDIFLRETRALFRRRLAGVVTRDVRATIMDEAPPPGLKLPINSRYPDAVPLSTVPTQVLEALPKLPPELEYRFIGDRLILMDVHAHIIVDLIESALPR